MINELISVIVPIYNTGPYLARCVESILAQDYHEIEILLVDDGSTDIQTRLLCDAFAENNANVRVFHKSNGGLSSARNFGITQARGEYLGFVDSDDVIEPNMYSSLLSDIHSHNVRIAIGNIATEMNGNVIDKREVLPSGVYNNTGLLHYFLLGHWHSACTNLYAKNLFDKAFFPEGEINEDYILNYHLYKEQECAFYNDTVFYHYVRRTGSITSSPASLAFLDWLKHTTYIRKDLSGRKELREEVDYQYLYSNIILGNKCLLTLAKGASDDANELYRIASQNLKKERKNVLSNKFLSVRYRSFGILLSYVPLLYKRLALPIIRVIK